MIDFSSADAELLGLNEADAGLQVRLAQTKQSLNAGDPAADTTEGASAVR